MENYKKKKKERKKTKEKAKKHVITNRKGHFPNYRSETHIGT